MYFYKFITRLHELNFKELLQHKFHLNQRSFPLLPQSDELRKQAEQQNEAIEQIVQGLSSFNDCKNLSELLRKHIRFEERELFEAIQVIT